MVVKYGVTMNYTKLVTAAVKSQLLGHHVTQGVPRRDRERMRHFRLALPFGDTESLVYGEHVCLIFPVNSALLHQYETRPPTQVHRLERIVGSCSVRPPKNYLQLFR